MNFSFLYHRVSMPMQLVLFRMWDTFHAIEEHFILLCLLNQQIDIILTQLNNVEGVPEERLCSEETKIKPFHIKKETGLKKSTKSPQSSTSDNLNHTSKMFKGPQNYDHGHPTSLIETL